LFNSNINLKINKEINLNLLIYNNQGKFPTVIKEMLENALRIKQTKPQLVSENYYKSKGNKSGKQKNKNFVYELIPSDNYEKNNKKTFSLNPEKNLIEIMKIEKILKDEHIPLQEKVKNFDIHFETKIEEFRTLKGENCHFNHQFHKFYRNGEYVEFEPFKAKNDNVQEIQNVLGKKIFDQIILAYEKKNYKIPDIIQKNIFEITPMLVDLNKIKEYYKIPKRLEDAGFLEDIKRMIAINSSVNSEGRASFKEFIDYCESDFLLKNNEHKNKEENELKQKNKMENSKNLQLKGYVQNQAGELKKILDANIFIKDKLADNVQDKENINPNQCKKAKKIFFYFYF
jgi:hypothetical protein